MGRFTLRTIPEPSKIRGPLRLLVAVGAALGLVLGAATAAMPPSATPAAAAPASLSVDGLRVNGLTDPLGIDEAPPVFSWRSTSPERGVMQTAYEVRVTAGESTDASGDMWSSGKVASDEQLNVVYDGRPLESQTRYAWQVRVWDDHDSESAWSAPAWFETGLGAEGRWDADWIGAPNPADRLAVWSDYTVSVDFTMTNLVLGLYARAESTQNGYMIQLTVADGIPQFRPHVKVDGRYTVLANKDLSEFISIEELSTGAHTLSVTFEGSTMISSLDGVEIDRRRDTTFSQGYVGFRQSMVGGGPESSIVHSIAVESPTHGTLLETDFSDGQNPFTGGSVIDGDLQVTAPIEAILRSELAQPLLRKDFGVDREISSARLYSSARGVYEVAINGERVGDELLAPGMTEYKKRIDYQSYDVTELLVQGENAIGVKLGTGWYAGNVGSYGTGIWGDRTSFIGQLRIDYTDGSHEWVSTDSSWKTTAGPLVESDIIMGETYDARRFPDGWDSPGFADASWEPVGVVADGGARAKLSPQANEPVRVTEERPALSRTEITPGTWIYDMGQNMVGVARVTLTGVEGSTAVIRHGETIYQDGTLYTENLRGAKATDRYTFAETGTVTYTPSFTFHGFRYVEVTGVSEPPTTDQVTGLVIGSDLPNTGTLETSDPMLNQLQSNIVWGQRGNFLSIPTDTPARDERLAWTGDINVFAPTASYNQNTLNFLGDWLRTLQDSQGDNGDLPGVAPNIVGRCCGGGTGWSDAGITVPYTLWQNYGDTAVIRDNYDMMTRFMEFVAKATGPSLIRDHGNLGDWLNLDDPTESRVLGTAYYAYIAGQMSEMAAAIGNTDDEAHYADLANRITTVFVDEFVSDDGTVLGDSQTAYAIAIGMELIPDDRLQQVGDRFVEAIARRDNHLSTGFLGTPWLLPALTATGHTDLAYRLLGNDTYPSWGYEVKLGATTMWERWDAVNPDGTFVDGGLNSFNHYAYGAVGDWMYANIGGISATSAGYRTFDIAPAVGGGLSHATGSLESVYGTISSAWTTTETGLTLSVSVPVNTKATVTIPAASVANVREGGVSVDEVDGISVQSEDGGNVVLEIGSGDYSFESGDIEADVTPPTVSIDVSGASGDEGWLTSGATATLTATDEVTEAPSIEVKVGEGEWQSYTTPLALVDGVYTVFARARDDAANTSSIEEAHVKIDSAVPGVRAWLDDDGRLTAAAVDAVPVGVLARAAATSPPVNSGAAAIEYSADGENWSPSPDAVGAAPAAWVRALDAAGNRTAPVAVTSSGDPVAVVVAGGETLLAQRTGFVAGELVHLALDSESTVIGSERADDSGFFSLDASVPAEVGRGEHALVFLVGDLPGGGDGGGDGATPPNGDGETPPSGGTIASTGIELSVALGFALVMLIAGASALLVRRRRAGRVE